MSAAPVISDPDWMKDLLTRLLDIDPDPGVYPNDEIVRALADSNIVGFHSDMTNLTEEYIDKLVVPAKATAVQKPLPIESKRKLKMLLHCYHHYCRTVNGVAPSQSG